MKTALLVICLLLALYGLSRLLSRLLLWLSRPEKGAWFLLVPLRDDASINARLQSAREHLYAGGFANSVRLTAVDCGLSVNRRQQAATICRNWRVALYDLKDLERIVGGATAKNQNTADEK